MKITKEQLKQIIKEELAEMLDPETGESPDQIGGMIAEIDEIIERNLREGSVERAVWELEHYTPDQIAEYAGSLTSMDRLKAQFIQAIEDTMRY